VKRLELAHILRAACTIAGDQEVLVLDSQSDGRRNRLAALAGRALSRRTLAEMTHRLTAAPD